MNSDNLPIFELEKDAALTEVENGLIGGMRCLHNDEGKKPEDHFHNTRYLLRQYRRVKYAIDVSETDLNLRMELEHGTKLATLEVNAELAGIDLSGSKLEGYTRSVLRSRKMLKIIDHALEKVRLDPDHGELLYQILYRTYFSEQTPKNRSAIIAGLETSGYPMSPATYHHYLNMGIKAIDHILWGYTALDCMEILKNFLP